PVHRSSWSAVPAGVRVTRARLSRPPPHPLRSHGETFQSICPGAGSRGQAGGVTGTPVLESLPEQDTKQGAAPTPPALRRRRLRPLAALPYLVLALALTAALAPGLFTTYDPLAGNPAAALQAPSGAHLFGTDATGRDVFSRVAHGAIPSLSGALIAVAVGLVGGTALGVLAGTIGGVVDDLIMRIVDVLLAIPGLLLSLSVIIVL